MPAAADWPRAEERVRRLLAGGLQLPTALGPAGRRARYLRVAASIVEALADIGETYD